MNINVLRIDKELPELSYATDGSLAIDVRASAVNGSTKFPFVIRPGEKAKIATGFAVDLSSLGPSVGAILLPRSGLGTKLDIGLANTLGLIDNDYQGEIIAVLKNNGTEPFEVMKYDRIGQLAIVPFLTPSITYVEHFDHVTGRGTNGFGSTGM